MHRLVHIKKKYLSPRVHYIRLNVERDRQTDRQRETEIKTERQRDRERKRQRDEY